MKKLFIDVSSLLIYARNIQQPSGIQRVTLMFIDEAIKIIGQDRVFISYYEKSESKYVAVPASVLSDINAFDMAQFSAAMGISGGALYRLPSLEKYRKSPTKHWFHRIVRDFNAATGNEAHFKKRRLTLEKWKQARLRVRELQRSGQDLRPQPLLDVAKAGDDLILPDANWDVLEVEKSISSIGQAGVIVTSLIHDLIPIVTPQFVASTHSFKFGRWLLDTTKYSGKYIANSKATGDDLRAFLDAYGLELEVKDVPLAQAGLAKSSPLLDDEDINALGVDISKHPALARVIDVTPDISSLTKTPYVLCVGTIEVRKNAWRIAQAWKRIVQKGLPGAPKLVFAGRPGWFVEDFFRFMDGSGWVDGWIHMVDGPSDEALEFLYKNCEFTITASMYEGWGLPIGEGLSYGKTGVVSNVSSMPEVGGDMVEYCDPMSIASIQAACEKLITDPDHRKMLEDRIATTQLRSWRDVTVDILKAIDVKIPVSDVHSNPHQVAV
jgi:glycosyltransferase involved in cell wall biosynthesis